MIDLKSTHVYREIHEQPDVLARLLKEERGTVEALAAEIKRRDIQYVVIAARGTSDNAGRYAQYLLGAMNGLYVGLATPSLFTIYDARPGSGMRSSSASARAARARTSSRCWLRRSGRAR